VAHRGWNNLPSRSRDDELQVAELVAAGLNPLDLVIA
jgi:hypothetical protein